MARRGGTKVSRALCPPALKETPRESNRDQAPGDDSDGTRLAQEGDRHSTMAPAGGQRGGRWVLLVPCPKQPPRTGVVLRGEAERTGICC